MWIMYKTTVEWYDKNTVIERTIYFSPVTEKNW